MQWLSITFSLTLALFVVVHYFFGIVPLMLVKVIFLATVAVFGTDLIRRRLKKRRD